MSLHATLVVWLSYAVPQNLKSSWEGQLVLETFAYHIRRVGGEFIGLSGKPVGALALSAAAVSNQALAHRAHAKYDYGQGGART